MPGRVLAFRSLYNRNVTLPTENVLGFFFFVSDPNCYRSELLDLFGVLKRVLISL